LQVASFITNPGVRVNYDVSDPDDPLLLITIEKIDTFHEFQQSRFWADISDELMNQLRESAMKQATPVSTPEVDDPCGAGLTEREVANCLALSMTEAAIARKLTIGEATARFHCRNIIQKWNLVDQPRSRLHEEARNRRC
jgi:DNA-binding NarL/FixJ family response regulator